MRHLCSELTPIESDTPFLQAATCTGPIGSSRKGGLDGLYVSPPRLHWEVSHLFPSQRLSRDFYFPRSAFGADGSSLLSLPSSRSTKGNWPGRDGRHAPAGTNTAKRRGLRVASVKVAQSCPTLCDPVDSTIHGILQARILE